MCTPSYAEWLDLDQVLKAAEEKAYEPKIAAANVEISKAKVWEARSEYLPTVRGQLNAEYQKDLTNETSAVTSVGNTVIPTGTRFQNSVSLSANHTLFDFGARGQKVKLAKADTRVQKATFYQSTRDLRLRIIELYTDILILQQNQDHLSSLIPIYRSVYKVKQRLYEPGRTSRVEVSEAAIQVAEALDQIEKLKEDRQTKLNELSVYTLAEYNAQDTLLEDLQAPADTDTKTLKAHIEMDVQHSPEAAYYDAQIKGKKAERSVIKRQYLPTVQAYFNYTLYGFDPDQYWASVGDIANRNLYTGLTISVPIFDGFKGLAQLKRNHWEIEKLRLEKAHQLAKLKSQIVSQIDISEQLVNESTSKKAILDEASTKLNMLERLSEQQLIEHSTKLKALIEETQKEHDLYQTEVKRRAALYKVYYYSHS